MTKTYVLAGHDWNNSFKGDVEAWEKRAKEKGDVIVIYPQQGRSMKDVANQIQTPANVVLLAHGSNDGFFTWDEKGPRIQHSVLFLELKDKHPQGIESITINSCYGETAVAQDMLKYAPNGTLVQAQNGAKVVGWGDSGRSANEIINHDITPLSILLESLDRVDPKAFNSKAKNYVDWYASQGQKVPDYSTSNPNDVLPHTIGIGGNPPTTLDLNLEMAKLSQSKRGVEQGAIQKVKDHFDPSDWSDLKTPEALNAKIDAVAQKIKNGENTRQFDIDEKRIAYGLTVANLYETGSMQQMIAEKQGIKKVEEFKSPPPPPPEKTPEQKIKEQFDALMRERGDASKEGRTNIDIKINKLLQQLPENSDLKKYCFAEDHKQNSEIAKRDNDNSYKKPDQQVGLNAQKIADIVKDLRDFEGGKNIIFSDSALKAANAIGNLDGKDGISEAELKAVVDASKKAGLQFTAKAEAVLSKQIVPNNANKSTERDK